MALTRERVSAIVMTGPREGELVLLDPEVVSQAPTEGNGGSIVALNQALDDLNAGLDRLVAAIQASADDYAAAAHRMEGTR